MVLRLVLVFEVGVESRAGGRERSESGGGAAELASAALGEPCGASVSAVEVWASI